MAGVSSQRGSYTKVRSCESGKVLQSGQSHASPISFGNVAYHRLYVLENTSVVQQPYSIPSNETSKGISSDAELRDGLPVLLQLLKSSLNLICNALATKLDAVVGKAASIALGYKNVEIRVPLPNAGGEIFEVVWFAPQTGPYQPNKSLECRERRVSPLEL